MILRNQIYEKNQNNINQCDLCFEYYDKEMKRPYLICPNQHNCCGLCVQNLKNIGKCPFCKQIINFSMISLNNYILEKLPNFDQPGNLQGIQFDRLNYQQNILNNIQNNLSNQYYSPTGHNYEPIPFYHQNQPNFSTDNPINNLNGPSPTSLKRGYFSGQYPPSCSQIFEKGDKQYYIYSITFIFQIPFLLIDFAFALFGSQQQCYDKYLHGFIEYTVRKVLFFVVGIQALFMVILLINALLRKTTCLQTQKFRTVSFVVFFMWMIKATLWMLSEYDLFDRYISENCSGFFYAYCLVLAVMNGIIIGIFGILSFFRGYR